MLSGPLQVGCYFLSWLREAQVCLRKYLVTTVPWRQSCPLWNGATEARRPQSPGEASEGKFTDLWLPSFLTGLVFPSWPLGTSKTRNTYIGPKTIFPSGNAQLPTARCSGTWHTLHHCPVTQSLVSRAILGSHNRRETMSILAPHCLTISAAVWLRRWQMEAESRGERCWVQVITFPEPTAPSVELFSWRILSQMEFLSWFSAFLKDKAPKFQQELPKTMNTKILSSNLCLHGAKIWI